MFKKIIVLVSILVSLNNLYAQTFTDSNLPIVLINSDLDTAGNPILIPDDFKILGNMKIIKHVDGSRNYLTDISTASYLNYNGRIGIETRGSSSQSLPKKPYSITTLIAGSTVTTSTQNVSLLAMPAENDWILNSLAFDPSLIRDYLAYNLSRQMGNYTTKTEYCEVVINGEYMGLYLLQEKIKADTNRVNILKITATDNSLPNISGGYITKADKTTGGDPIAWTSSVYGGNDVDYIHELPKPINVTAQQNTYIYSQFNNLQTAVSANNSSLLDGYTNTIDVPSFVDFMVSNEFASNVDGYQLSTYFHKDRNGKLRAGPIWDFNLTLGNDLFQWGYNRSFYDIWQFSNNDNEGSKFWTDLFNNSEFKCYLSKRFHELTLSGQPMNASVLNLFIDNTISLISEAMVRENSKWGTIPNNASEISNLKTWITNRITWMNNNLGSFVNCSNIVTPQLVISQINYNPSVFGTSSSNDQEFIQITNAGSTSIDLSGIYFSKLGMSYQFPINSSITGNSSLYIASNATVFQTRNGFAPFGQFTRNLSNKSQDLVLADAFGNIIDNVEYFDSAPWPTAADGLGSYLQLTNNNLDNNIASSWVASSTNLSNNNFDINNYNISIYPNPAKNKISVNSSIEINKIEIIDVYGKIISSENVKNTNYSIQVSNLSNGIYFIKLQTEIGIKIQKFIKI